MAISIKTSEELEIMREGGKILAETLSSVAKIAKAGMSTEELDIFAENFIRSHSGIPAFKGYHGFPATLCTGVNNVIVHGIPKKNEILVDGDLLTIDCGVLYKGRYTDAAVSIGIGEISPLKTKLIKTAYESLYSAIDVVKPGLHLCEIGKTIQEIVEKNGFHIVQDLTGHGIGKNLHEDPVVLNYWDGDPGPILKAGMTIAIEPIFAVGTGQMRTLQDKWTIVTKDGSCAVQVEHTIAVTENGAEILTK